jgi:membrane protein DedA with SNARE-associated domain
MSPSAILEYLVGLPPALIYLLIGAGAAIENIIPPVPADTFVLLGAFVAANGNASPFLVFLVTWGANVLSALIVFAIARRFGPSFFERHRIGHWLIRPRQLARITRFYDRWGTPAILVSRFLPAFRAIVPVFAGITRVPKRRVILPVAAASAAWYGLLVFLGTTAGRNLDAILAALDRAGAILVVVALILVVLGGVWWWKTRHEPHEPE